MGKIAYAYIAYKDDKKNFVTVQCKNIRLKKNSKNHITPSDENDFSKKSVYYAKWQDCDDKCVEDHEHFGYYPAFILLLGESEEQIQQKVKAGRRLIIPNVLESEESEEHIRTSQVKEKRSTTVQDVKKKQGNAILDKYKRQLFIKSRNAIHSSEDEESNVETKAHLSVAELDVPNKKQIEMSQDHEKRDKSNLGLKDLQNTKKDMKETLIARDKEIQALRDMIFQLQKNQNRTSPPTILTGDMKAAEVNTARRALFHDDCHRGNKNAVPKEHEANVEIRNESNGDGCSSSTKCMEAKVAIRKVEKVNVNVKKIIHAEIQASSSIHNKIRIREDQSKNRKVSCKMGKVEVLGYKKKTGPTENIEMMNENERPGCSSSTTRRQRINVCQRTRESSTSSDDQKVSASEGDSDHDNATQAKRRLYPIIKKRKSDHMHPEVNKKIVTEIKAALQYYEQQEIDQYGRKRYEVTGDKIYLGEGLEVSSATWYMIQHSKPSIFFKDMTELLWGQRKLVNRCQNKSKVTTTLIDRSPMKELTPEKKRLSYKLYSDHLDAKQYKGADKMKLMLQVPLLYSTKINYLRSKHYTTNE